MKNDGKFTAPQPCIVTVQQSWGGAAPDWVLVLAEVCDAKTQIKVGHEIGYSSSVVNAVLKNAYTGNVAKVESAVRGRYMAKTVMCPVVGEMGSDVCLWHQKRSSKDAPTTSAMRSAISSTCRSGTCPHSRIGEDRE